MSWLNDLIGVRDVYVDGELQPSRGRLNLVAGEGIALEAADDPELAATVVTISSDMPPPITIESEGDDVVFSVFSYGSAQAGYGAGIRGTVQGTPGTWVVVGSQTA